MKKKLLSLALALCMVFGSAASLPQGAFTETAGITASAAAPTINTKSVTLYALDDWAKEYISIPSTLNTEYQLKVSNAKNVFIEAAKQLYQEQNNYKERAQKIGNSDDIMFTNPTDNLKINDEELNYRKKKGCC